MNTDFQKSTEFTRAILIITHSCVKAPRQVCSLQETRDSGDDILNSRRVVAQSLLLGLRFCPVGVCRQPLRLGGFQDRVPEE